MIKKTGDKKVATYDYSRGGLTCDIYLRGTIFVATFLQKEFDAPDVNILRRKLDDYAEHWLTMEWYPVIEMVTGEGVSSRHYRDDPDTESVEFGCERYYVSISPAGMICTVGWDINEKHRKAEMTHYTKDGYGPYGDRKGGSKLRTIGLPVGAPLALDKGKYLMDYSPELWARCQSIEEGIRMMRKKLAEMISTDKGLNTLLTTGGGELLLKDQKKK